MSLTTESMLKDLIVPGVMFLVLFGPFIALWACVSFLTLLSKIIYKVFTGKNLDTSKW